MFLSLKTGPAVEPVSRADAKTHLRVDHDDEDGLIDSLITAARLMVEARTGRALITQSWVFYIDLPSGAYELPLKPAKEISGVKVFDDQGNETSLTDKDYVAETRGEEIKLRLKNQAHRAEVEFTAGYGDQADDVPAPLIQAVLQLASYWFENRGNSSVMGSDMPKTVSALLAPYRNVRL